MVAIMIVLLAVGIAILAALLWVACSAAEEEQNRSRRVQRDFDLKRGRHP
jgi:HAMP domain-containing protein